MAEEKEKVVKFSDMVTVYGTDKAKQLEASKEYSVHTHLAEKLIKKGEATKTKPKGE